jgi:AraC-like DNA-binding protein
MYCIAPPDLRRKKELAVACILVVDDDPGVREALDALLSPPYCVHSASSGREALALLPRDGVDAILLDVLLGDEDGLSLIGPFRRLSQAPIIVITGNSTEDRAIRAANSPVHGYLRKPIDPEALKTKLASIVASGPPAHGLAARARRCIDQDPAHPHSVSVLADVAGFSERQLLRQFVATYGMTPRRYQIGMQLAEAARLLSESPLPIQGIVARTGFSTLRTFERLFRHAYGVTPRAFRAARLDGMRENGKAERPSS